MRRLRPCDVLTMTEAARLLYCSISVINKCGAAGILAFYRLPGSTPGHRRFVLADVEAFARREGIPLDRIEAWKQQTIKAA